MRREYTGRVNAPTVVTADGYSFDLRWVQDPGEQPVIEEVFINGSTHNAIDFIDPKMISYWAGSLAEEAASLREDYAYS